MIKMNDFVIQEHIIDDQSHWDFMVRCGEILLTWQIDTPPEKWSESEMICKKIFDHRLKYLTYEGPISDNRGYVRIVCRGQYFDPKGTLMSCLPFDEVELVLRSEIVHGEMSLVRQNDDQWKFSYQNKDFPCTI